MTEPFRLPDLSGHAASMRRCRLRDVVGEEGRLATFVLQAAGLRIDMAKRRWDPAVLETLLAIARERRVQERFADQLSGIAVNGVEGRAALHTAWRSDSPNDEIARSKTAQARFVDWARDQGFRQVLHLGIGGSDLGPRLVVDALSESLEAQMDVRFVSNVDPAALDRALKSLDPKATLVLIVSKSFTTQETMLNAHAAKAWLSEALGAERAAAHLAACTARPERAAAEPWCIASERIFAFPDDVGGRFSLWSAAGLGIALGFGWPAVRRLHTGAQVMDSVCLEAEGQANPALMLALLDWWARNGLGEGGRVVVAYAEALKLLPTWLQQLEMESLGKSVRSDGSRLDEASVGSVWGGAGTDAQHAFFQSLHQGEALPVEFIGVAGKAGADERGRALLAAMIAQGEALLLGRSQDEACAAALDEGANREEAARLGPHRTFPGERESTTLLLPDLSPESLGALIALYEHKTAMLGYLMGVNPFDQWGVELGKELGRQALQDLTGDHAETARHDPATAALLDAVRAKRS